MNNRVLFVVGYSGVGKSTFSEAYSKVSGEKKINGGDILSSYFEKLGIHFSRETVGSRAIEILGENGVANLIFNETVRTNSKILDGVRLFSTYKYFKDEGINVDVLMLLMDENKRYTNLVERNYLDDKQNDLTLQLSEKEWKEDWEKYYYNKKWEFKNNGDKEDIIKFAKWLNQERMLKSIST